MSRICHKYGFVFLNWLLTIIAVTQAIFNRRFHENYAKIICIAKSNFSWQWIVSQTTSMSDKYLRERILILSLFALRLHYSSKKVKCVNFIVIHGVALCDATQKRDSFWFPGTKSFPTVYYINDFVVKISGHYHTLNCEDLAIYIDKI